jgi:hypothetical protein
MNLFLLLLFALGQSSWAAQGCREDIRERVCFEEAKGKCADHQSGKIKDQTILLQNVYDKLDENLKTLLCSLDRIYSLEDSLEDSLEAILGATLGATLGACLGATLGTILGVTLEDTVEDILEDTLETEDFFAEVYAPNLNLRDNNFKTITKPPYTIRLALNAFKTLDFEDSLTAAEWHDLTKRWLKDFEHFPFAIQADGAIKQDPQAFLYYVIIHELGHFFDSLNLVTSPFWFGPVDPQNPLPPEAYRAAEWNEISAQSNSWANTIKKIDILRQKTEETGAIKELLPLVSEIYNLMPTIPSLSVYSVAGNSFIYREDFAETFAFYFLHKRYADLRLENSIDGTSLYSLTDKLKSNEMKRKIEILENKISTGVWTLPRQVDSGRKIQ